MLWVYDHYRHAYSFSAGIDFFQNLTTVDCKGHYAYCQWDMVTRPTVIISSCFPSEEVNNSSFYIELPSVLGPRFGHNSHA